MCRKVESLALAARFMELARAVGSWVARHFFFAYVRTTHHKSDHHLRSFPVEEFVEARVHGGETAILNGNRFCPLPTLRECECRIYGVHAVDCGTSVPPTATTAFWIGVKLYHWSHRSTEPGSSVTFAFKARTLARMRLAYPPSIIDIADHCGVIATRPSSLR